VTLTNLDPVMDHTITSGTNGVPDGKFDSNFVHFAESRSVVLVDGLPPGRYPFYCTEHTFMHGILVVQ
jgi:plastocyanin